MLYKASPRTDIRLEGIFLSGLLLPREEGYPPKRQNRRNKTKDITCRAHGNKYWFCQLHSVGLWFPSRMLLKRSLLGGTVLLAGLCFMYTCRQGTVSTGQSLPMLSTGRSRQALHLLHPLSSQGPEELGTR